MATLFVDNLTVVDFSYLHAKRGMVGESWIVDLQLSGELDARGMIFDFGEVKKEVKALIDECMDHRLLVPRASPLLDLNDESDDQTSLEWRYSAGHIRLTVPKSSVLVLPEADIGEAGAKRYLMARIDEQLPDNVADVQVILRQEETGTAPTYHYSHGLRKHEGNCQRIAHGHRSGIHIFENGRRSRYWEKVWADRWEDIYLGSRTDLQGTYYLDEVPHLRFRYDAPQGHFELILPEDHCYLLDTDTTVEYLAAHIAEQLASEAPGRHFRVRAFEGINKGAIAEAGENAPGRVHAHRRQHATAL